MTTRFEIKETGRKFAIGDSMRPSWDDLRAVMITLEKMDLARFLWPTLNTGVKGASRVQVEAAVPEALANARMIMSRLDEPTKGCLWVLAWYNHIWMGGIRPNMKERPPTIRVMAPARFRCPICGEPYFFTRQTKDQGAAIRQYNKWLQTHSRVRYHNRKPTKRLPMRLEPTKYKEHRLAGIKPKKWLPRPVPDMDVQLLMAEFESMVLEKPVKKVVKKGRVK